MATRRVVIKRLGCGNFITHLISSPVLWKKKTRAELAAQLIFRPIDVLSSVLPPLTKQCKWVKTGKIVYHISKLFIKMFLTLTCGLRQWRRSYIYNVANLIDPALGKLPWSCWYVLITQKHFSIFRVLFSVITLSVCLAWKKILNPIFEIISGPICGDSGTSFNQCDR